jgi:hypothetical protein
MNQFETNMQHIAVFFNGKILNTLISKTFLYWHECGSRFPQIAWANNKHLHPQKGCFRMDRGGAVKVFKIRISPGYRR